MNVEDALPGIMIPQAITFIHAEASTALQSVESSRSKGNWDDILWWKKRVIRVADCSTLRMAWFRIAIFPPALSQGMPCNHKYFSGNRELESQAT